MIDVDRWKKLVDLEPKLGELEADIKAVSSKGKTFCANTVWGRQFKPRMSTLVGWDSKNPKLQSEATYDYVYDKLYNLLPDCKGCSCL